MYRRRADSALAGLIVVIITGIAALASGQVVDDRYNRLGASTA